jgi:hypothetical protein
MAFIVRGRKWRILQVGENDVYCEKDKMVFIVRRRNGFYCEKEKVLFTISAISPAIMQLAQ